MHAARIIEPTPETGHEAMVEDAVPLRVASEQDEATASPVHALHAQLAEALDRRPLGPIDPVRAAFGLVAIVYTVGAWLGLVSLGSFLVHHWTSH